MLFATNTASVKFSLGLTTAATFRGLPIIGVCTDYNDSITPDTNNPTAAANIFAYAEALDVPAVVTDVAHDGAGVGALLLQLLQYLAPLCVPGFTGPYLHSQGGAAPAAAVPPCGPLIDMEPDAGSKLKIKAVARATLNLRRNHRYGQGCDALWPNVVESVRLVQRPPIYAPRFTKYTSGAPVTVWLKDPGTAYFDTLAAVWRAPQTGYVDGVTTIRDVLLRGYEALAVLEVDYPDITRHIAPWLVPFLRFGF